VIFSWFIGLLFDGKFVRILISGTIYSKPHPPPILSGKTMFGCHDVWMFGCLDVWMFGCLDVWMLRCLDVAMSWFPGEKEKEDIRYFIHQTSADCACRTFIIDSCWLEL
jgi:hypothetical protein